MVRQTKLNYEPGAEYAYTNSGYTLAAAVVQRISGQSLAQFTQERLFRPLGMGKTQWRDDFRRVVRGRAIAYRWTGKAWEQDMPFEDTYGHGALLTTVGDLLVWNEALTAGRLGPVVTAELQRQSKLNDGRTIASARGLFVDRHYSNLEIAHGGATAGYRTWLARYPERGFSVALLCNAADASSGDLGHKVVDAYLPPPPINAPEPSKPASEALEGRAGGYLDERTGLVSTLTVRDGSLVLRGLSPLTPVAPGRYSLAGGEVVFAPDGGFERRTAEGEAQRYRKIATWSPTPQELSAAAGRYASAEADATHILTLRDGKLTLTPEDRPSAAVALTPIYQDAFRISGADTVRLIRGQGGRVEGLSFWGPRIRDLRSVRVSD
ncbi:serine hydrolase [Phenylobacterium sp. J367]|uniref:serine hydrolase domain-containing protein n=1 Tax=Phenylobacterium sp. J367 TaxID=2898435 RepID=UPI00215083CE|nr:serine hydrolase domain-containing protein [Phenylobacterium sp. J367]